MKRLQHPHRQQQPATPGPQPAGELTEEQLQQVVGGANKVPPGPNQLQPAPTAVE